jgi:hypothetical protein
LHEAKGKKVDRFASRKITSLQHTPKGQLYVFCMGRYHVERSDHDTHLCGSNNRSKHVPKNVVVVLDACHWGGMRGNSRRRVNPRPLLTSHSLSRLILSLRLGIPSCAPPRYISIRERGRSVWSSLWIWRNVGGWGIPPTSISARLSNIHPSEGPAPEIWNLAEPWPMGLISCKSNDGRG